MYEIEFCLPDRPSIQDLLSDKGKFESHDAEIFYEEGIIRVNLTWLWGHLGDYNTFVDELVGTIIHEYLHYFFHVNGLPQNEEMIDRLSFDLQILSLGRLIGATDNTGENVRQYKKCIDIRFSGKIDS